MIHLRTKKWWWPLIRLCIDVAINNAFQLYRMRQLNEGENRTDYLEFRKVIFETYRKNYTTKMSPSTFSQIAKISCSHGRRKPPLDQKKKSKVVLKERVQWDFSVFL